VFYRDKRGEGVSSWHNEPRTARHDMNQTTHKLVIERDDNECQLSEIFGIAHLSGVPCVKEKEVHHKTYERFNEEELDDLIVVCRRCHDFLTSYIRGLRYSIRNGDLKLEDAQTVEPLVTQERNRNEDLELSDNGSSATDPAQWIAGRSALRRNDLDLQDFPETTKDGSRSRGDGTA